MQAKPVPSVTGLKLVKNARLLRCCNRRAGRQAEIVLICNKGAGTPSVSGGKRLAWDLRT